MLLLVLAVTRTEHAVKGSRHGVTALERRAAVTVTSSGKDTDEWQPLAGDKN